MYLVQQVRAPNDTNGNPRRAFIVYCAISARATVVGAYDVGYEGRSAVPEKFRDAVRIPTIDVPVSEYLSWLAWGDEGNKLASMRGD